MNEWLNERTNEWMNEWRYQKLGRMLFHIHIMNSLKRLDREQSRIAVNRNQFSSGWMSFIYMILEDNFMFLSSSKIRHTFSYVTLSTTSFSTRMSSSSEQYIKLGDLIYRHLLEIQCPENLTIKGGSRRSIPRENSHVSIRTRNGTEKSPKN